jgi:hypothetical protein
MRKYLVNRLIDMWVIHYELISFFLFFYSLPYILDHGSVPLVAAAMIEATVVIALGVFDEANEAF